MERLTERTHGSIADELVEEMGNPIDSVFVKKEMYKDCLHICDKNESCDDCPLYEVMRKLADYEDAEEQGLLLRLPCKVGSTLYQCHFINRQKIEREFKVIGLVFDIVRNVWLYEVAYQVGVEWRKTVCSFDDIGLTVFLTREEAEKALAERQKG